MSKLRDAALRLDLTATLWRIGVTQDNREICDLLPEQLRALAAKYPVDCDQLRAINRLIESKEIPRTDEMPAWARYVAVDSNWHKRGICARHVFSHPPEATNIVWRPVTGECVVLDWVEPPGDWTKTTQQIAPTLCTQLS